MGKKLTAKCRTSSSFWTWPAAGYKRGGREDRDLVPVPWACSGPRRTQSRASPSLGFPPKRLAGRNTGQIGAHSELKRFSRIRRTLFSLGGVQAYLGQKESGALLTTRRKSPPRRVATRSLSRRGTNVKTGNVRVFSARIDNLWTCWWLFPRPNVLLRMREPRSNWRIRSCYKENRFDRTPLKKALRHANNALNVALDTNSIRISIDRLWHFVRTDSASKRQRSLSVTSSKYGNVQLAWSPIPMESSWIRDEISNVSSPM